MKDPFIEYIFGLSPLAKSTKYRYKNFISRLCHHAHKQHPLDVTVDEVIAWLVSLDDMALSSRDVAHAAVKTLYCHLAKDHISKEQHAAFFRVFSLPRRHHYTLLAHVSHSDIQRFLTDVTGKRYYSILHTVYIHGCHAEDAMSTVNIFYSMPYLQQVCAKHARAVDIPHGFGLRGLRASGIIHALQDRNDDTELVEIYERTGLSWAAFQRYIKAAGV